jgi:hypothetical protein
VKVLEVGVLDRDAESLGQPVEGGGLGEAVTHSTSGPDRRRRCRGPAGPVPSVLADTEAFMTTPVDTVRCFYEALGCGDIPAVLSLFDARVVLHQQPEWP